MRFFAIFKLFLLFYNFIYIFYFVNVASFITIVKFFSIYWFSFFYAICFLPLRKQICCKRILIVLSRRRQLWRRLWWYHRQVKYFYFWMGYDAIFSFNAVNSLIWDKIFSSQNPSMLKEYFCAKETTFGSNWLSPISNPTMIPQTAPASMIASSSVGLILSRPSKYFIFW